MKGKTVGVLAMGFVGFWAQAGWGQVETFVDDFDGWAAATGDFLTIDFETLPDGNPSVGLTPINDSFNYTSQGAFFSSPFDDLLIDGNPPDHSFLRSDSGTIANPSHIQGELVEEAFAVGFIFPGNATFDVFDMNDDLIASAFLDSSGSGHFQGVVSDIPISYVIMDEGTAVGIDSFHFAAVPEPGTAGLLGLGAAWVLRRRRGGGSWGVPEEAADRKSRAAGFKRRLRFRRRVVRVVGGFCR